MQSISPKQLKKDDLILDVRGCPGRGQIILNRPHWNVPIEMLNPKDFIKRYELDGKKTLYTICTTGRKAAIAAQMFINSGFKNVVVVKGGVTQAAIDGLPVLRTHIKIPMERQVRLFAGLLVLLGTLLGIFVNSWWLAVPLFIGSGLTYSGITNWCGMMWVLEKMPWNK